MDVNQLVKDAESDLVRWLTSKVVTGLVSKITWLGGLSGPLGFILSLIIGQLVKYGDWGVFALGKDWMNTVEGKEYEKAGIELNNLPPEASKEEVERAKQKKRDAFDRLMDAD